MTYDGKIEIEIEGTSPLLMNKFHIEALERQSVSKTKITKKADDKYGTPEAQAEQSAYFASDGKSLCIPAENMMRAIISGAKSFTVKVAGRSRGTSLAKSLGGALKIEPFEILLTPNKYEIDARGVVIQKGRVVRYRAKLPIWKARFFILYDKTILDSPSILEEVIADTGTRIGLMDFRPEKMGSFGCFKVTKFQSK